jgi:hypothetical protein
MIITTRIRTKMSRKCMLIMCPYDNLVDTVTLRTV